MELYENDMNIRNKKIRCDNKQLTDLDYLEHDLYLEVLFCFDNHITSLDKLPRNLKELQ